MPSSRISCKRSKHTRHFPHVAHLKRQQCSREFITSKVWPYKLYVKCDVERAINSNTVISVHASRYYSADPQSFPGMVFNYRQCGLVQRKTPPRKRDRLRSLNNTLIKHTYCRSRLDRGRVLTFRSLLDS